MLQHKVSFDPQLNVKMIVNKTFTSNENINGELPNASPNIFHYVPNHSTIVEHTDVPNHSIIMEPLSNLKETMDLTKDNL